MTTINQTTLPERLDKAYFFITGDQCALTDIRISRA